MPMNFMHRRLCSSADWAKGVAERMPDMLGGCDLGDAVLEIGPGYGATTSALLGLGVSGLTILEIDEKSAGLLRDRFGERVRVVHGDGADMPFPDNAFSSVVCFTMLHHIPEKARQDRLFAEAHRVLRPGGLMRAVDSQVSPRFRLLHIGDTMNVVDPETLSARLEKAGFGSVEVRHVPKERIMFTAHAA